MTDYARPPIDNARSEPFAHGREVRVIIGSSMDELVVTKTGSNPEAVTAIEREALVLSQIHHPNVVDLLRTERSDHSATLITQFAGRTTLAQFRPTDVATVARLGAALLTIVGELGDLGWVHGRIRPEHCIVGPGHRLTVCAFGAAHRADGADPRIAMDLDDAIAAISSVARRLGDPGTRKERARKRRLMAALTTITTPAQAETARVRLAKLAEGTAAPRALGEAHTTRPRDTRPSLNGPARSESTTRPSGAGRTRRPARSWRGAALSLAGVGALIGVVVLLRWLGGPVVNPFPTSGIPRLDGVPAPIALALELIRLVAFAASLYGIALAAATFAAIVTNRSEVVDLATKMAPPRLRKAIVVLIGLGVMSSAAGSASSTHRAPTTVAPTTSTTSTTTTTTTTTTAPQALPTALTIPAPSVPPAATALPRLWVIERGDHLWGVASTEMARHLGRPPLDHEVAGYWRSLIDLNRSSLADPDNPDLVFVGQVFELPPFI